MTDNEAKAVKTLQEADKKAKSGGGLMGMFSGGGKTEEACELYVRAANLFKMAKKWKEAGDAFVKSAELQLSKNDSKHEGANNYVDAATCYKKVNMQTAVDCLTKAVDVYTDMGRFTMAAKHHMSIAEMYESGGPEPDLDKAIVHYEKAADYYKGEESKSAANKCLLKVAEYYAQLEQYPKAIDIYEEIGTTSAESSLLKYSAKDHFFRAALCHLCVDLLNGQHALKRYQEVYPPFVDSRECKLLKELILALEEENADQFADAVKAYDSISRLDQWHTTILLRIKKSLQEGDVDLK